MSQPTDPVLTAELHEFFQEYQGVWNAHDYHLLKDHWDGDESVPVYLAEEQDDFVIGWDDLDRYFVNDPTKPSMIEAMWMRYRLTDAKLIAPDLAQVFGWLRHDMKMRGPMKPWGGESRFTAVVRRKPEGWRLVSYVEAHMTPLLYVQRLYEKNVSPEFADFHRAALEKQRPAAGDGAARPAGAAQPAALTDAVP